MRGKRAKKLRTSKTGLCLRDLKKVREHLAHQRVKGVPGKGSTKALMQIRIWHLQGTARKEVCLEQRKY